MTTKAYKSIEHVVEKIYRISQSNIIYGNETGICRITGKESVGIKFDSWVKPTFNDWAYLKPGDIISNAALFCFDEQSVFLQKKTGRDKPQKFRTYSHIVCDNEWYVYTKADKQAIFEKITAGAELVSLTDTGQKHVFFKHKQGMWQLDELFVKPDIEEFRFLHEKMCDMLRLGFSQKEVISGKYIYNRINLAGLAKWKEIENILVEYRGTGLFEFASWMLFISNEDKEKIQNMYKKKKEPKKEQMELWN